MSLGLIREQMQQRWREPSSQQRWCLFWLERAIQLGASSPLTITLGCDALTELKTAIQQELELRGVSGTVVIDPESPQGLTVSWGSEILDGSIAAQEYTILSATVTELASLLHSQLPSRQLPSRQLPGEEADP